MKNWAWLLLCCLIWNGCDSGGTTGGSETTNGLTGVLQDGEGKPIASAAVVLLPSTYNPIPGKDARTLKRTETDKSGRYRFAQVDAGVYNLEAKDSLGEIQVLVQGIKIDTGKHASEQADGVLEASGTLELPFADRHLPENAQAYILGTTFNTFVASKLNKAGDLVLPGLAAGEYSDLMAVSSDFSGSGSIIIAHNFRIGAGSKTALESLAGWSHARHLKLDATAFKAGLLEPVSGYPALLRLNSGNFDFSQARSGGEDIRFTNSSGKRLPYQIELWDAAKKAAVVWVRLDSVSRASIDTSLVMHWGREDAVDASHSNTVFDTAQGFASVWHFGETENAQVGGYKDAASGVYPATATPPLLPTQINAVTGFGQVFHPGGGQMTATLPAGLGGNSSFSVTFWMKINAVDTTRASILYFGADTVMKGFHFLIRKDTSTQFGPWDVAGHDSLSAAQNGFSVVPVFGQWAHIATVYDAVKGELVSYLNGKQVAVNALSTLDIRTGPGIIIGRRIYRSTEIETDFNGALDEMRFYKRPLTPSWIEAEYEFQKTNSTVLEVQ